MGVFQPMVLHIVHEECMHPYYMQNLWRQMIIPSRQTLCFGCWGWRLTIQNFLDSYYLVMRQDPAKKAFSTCTTNTFSLAAILTVLPLVTTSRYFRECLGRYPRWLPGRPLYLARLFDWGGISVSSWGKCFPVYCGMFSSLSRHTCWSPIIFFYQCL